MTKNIFDYFSKITKTVYEDVLKETGLDLQVYKRNQYYADALGKTRQNPEKVVIARKDDGDYLGTVGSDFGLVQFDELFKFAEILVEKEGAGYVCGGIIGRGERGFLGLRTGEHVNLGGGDIVENYFYIVTGHDGQQAIDVIPAPIRTVNNTVLKMPEAKGYRFRHTKHVNRHLAAAKLSVAKVQNYWATYQKSFKYLSAVKLTPKQLDDYLKMIVEEKLDEEGNPSARGQNIRDAIQGIFQMDRNIVSLPSTHGTLLGAYFAVIQYCDSDSVVRKAKNDRRDEETCKILSLIDGNAAQRKADGYAFAIKMMEKLGGVKVSI